ncbi:hypothetical protein BLNAU_5509 [Blattamonas nauphoetae]|uniref:Uncharacterized protein n=1 Tax=Blattamonas nauphoetae TaxID=2049346 RepID=A0ABQ9Y6U5_9EUKA|nr:hypothetical protein BLNAU_13876 [Blattamonas nauphoetae]KAK2959460.1 hypothetical protein BLNAU_5509 [Blattamonas nauphoetae]
MADAIHYLPILLSTRRVSADSLTISSNHNGIARKPDVTISFGFMLNSVGSGLSSSAFRTTFQGSEFRQIMTSTWVDTVDVSSLEFTVMADEGEKREREDGWRKKRKEEKGAYVLFTGARSGLCPVSSTRFILFSPLCDVDPFGAFRDDIVTVRRWESAPSVSGMTSSIPPSTGLFVPPPIFCL